MRYCILASGSRGNSLFIESVHGRFLVDVGLSARKIETRLKERDIDPKTIDAIVLTHSHGDHVRGVGVFAHRHKLPIYGHPETLDSITHLLKPAQEVIPWSAPFTVKDVRFTPFELPHDCEPTVGYLVQIIKGTSLAAIIGFVEVTRAGQIVNNATFQPLIVFSVVAAIYFVICWPLSLLAARMERKRARALAR